MAFVSPRTQSYNPVALYDFEAAVKQLLLDCLNYDEEYGALGNVSLIDKESVRELYVASFDPDLDFYLIEEATEWEEFDADEDNDPAYALAVDGKEYGTYGTPEEVVEVLITLGRHHDYAFRFMVLHEE